MTKKRIVLALGGNALGNTAAEQLEVVKGTVKAIAGLIEAGNEVVIAHGNGPQVGMINLAMETAGKADPKIPYVPMSVCVAMSQGYIGFDLQNALREELLRRGLDVPVCTLISQTVVDANDPAFKDPTKPIGAFYSEEEAARLTKEKGYVMKEDAGRGWRRVVASPNPVDIVEKATVKTLLAAGQVVIAAGGGGIPVCPKNGGYEGVSAVVDKDFASCVLAQIVDADWLIILTAVEKAALNYRAPNERLLDTISPQEALRYVEEGHFAPGSMLPKVQAAVRFAQSRPGRKALITLLEKAEDGIAGKTGTVIQG